MLYFSSSALTIGFNNKNTSVNEDNAVVTLIVEIQCGLLLVNQSIVVTLTLIDGSGSGIMVYTYYMYVFIQYLHKLSIIYFLLLCKAIFVYS